jgi:hypothetical protein
MMEELKKKQASAQKDRAAAAAADIKQHIIHRPPAVPSFVGPGTGKRRQVTRSPSFNNLGIISCRDVLFFSCLHLEFSGNMGAA